MAQTIKKISDTELEITTTDEHVDIVDKATLEKKKADAEAQLKEFD